MDKPTNKPRQNIPYSERKSPEIIFKEENEKEFGEEYQNILNPNKKDYNKFTETLKRYIEKNKKGISSSQLRNIYSRVKKIKDDPKELYLLRPKLAYVYGRATENGIKKLIVLLDEQIKNVKEKNQLQEFKDFFESIIAYHKFYAGGKD